MIIKPNETLETPGVSLRPLSDPESYYVLRCTSMISILDNFRSQGWSPEFGPFLEPFI